MATQFDKTLDALLAAKDADLMTKLKSEGYERVNADELDLSEVETVEDAAMVCGVRTYEVLRDRWLSLMNNNGMTDEELRRFNFTREGFKPRDVKQAIHDMAEAFAEMMKEAQDSVKKQLAGKAGIDVADVMSRIQFPQIMKRVIELPMMMPVEPVYNILPLFRKLAVPDMFGDVARFSFPVVGTLLEPHEMGEDSEAQEKDLDIAGGAMVAKFGKIGVAFKYSEDFNKFKNFDWFGLVLNACRQALAREKERRAYIAISTNGTTVINNQGRFGFSSTVVGGTVASAGTGVDGLRNGTHVLQDLFYMMTSFNDDGMFPDTILLSPRAWLIWAQSPEMRAFAFQNGIPQMWQMPQGEFGRVKQHEVFGGLLGAHGDHPRGSTTYTPHPTNMLPLPMRIVVNPQVTSGTDGSTEYTHAHVLDVATGIGYLMQAQEVMMSSWTDPEHDLEKVRFTERYAFGVLQDNLTIRHMKFLKTREIGVDARDKIMFSINWAGGVGGPHIGNV